MSMEPVEEASVVSEHKEEENASSVGSNDKKPRDQTKRIIIPESALMADPVYVDPTRATATIMRLDNRTAYGKAYYPWILMFSGAMMWGCLMAVSLTWGE